MIRIILLTLLMLTLPLKAQDQQPNHLLGTGSPYLQQHLYNPVDWYPWGEEALERARLENKLIFVSIGYSSCHWCHVMREESFEDEAIAAFMNEHFISIKIDRERRPDLDEQFMLATQVLTGSGGWPNNLILTPLGDPVFGGTYFSPAEFSELLAQMQVLWETEPELINAEGFKLALYLRNYLTRTAAEVDLTPEMLTGITDAMLGQMDDFNGGMGTAPKFPRETLFLFLMEQALRNGDVALLNTVGATLDGMIAGGIHDQIGGGFHRYSVDPEWHVPHFEKMLYNQAMIGLMLTRSIEATQNPAHIRALERLIDYILREMRDPGGAFYASQDADSLDMNGEKREGAFYVWTPEQITADAAYLTDLFQITENGELDGANVLHLPGQTPDYTRLDPLLATLLDTRNSRPAPNTDRKVLMGWNGMLIAMLAEASRTLDRPDLWQVGAEVASYLLDNLKTDQGYLRLVYEGTPELPAQLPDLGALALGLIALHDYAPNGQNPAPWLDEAHLIADAIRQDFGDAAEGYNMTANNTGFSPVVALDDGEIPSGNALALLTYSRLSRRSQAPELALEAGLLAATLSGHAAESPNARAASLAAISEYHLGETGTVRYVSGGAVRVGATVDTESQLLRVSINIKPGWHINAHEPLDDYFIPTDLTIGTDSLPPNAYPTPTIKSLGFNTEPLALYENTLTLTAALPTSRPATILLSLQVCSDEVCLAPETLVFSAW